MQIDNCLTKRAHAMQGTPKVVSDGLCMPSYAKSGAIVEVTGTSAMAHPIGLSKHWWTAFDARSKIVQNEYKFLNRDQVPLL